MAELAKYVVGGVSGFEVGIGSPATASGVIVSGVTCSGVAVFAGVDGLRIPSVS
jgi:hypothetical protein